MTNSLLNVLITGSDGQLGQALRQHRLGREFNLIACNKSELDITQPDSIAAALAKYQPNVIINTAAYTAVDRAESEPALAELINHQAVKHLALACHQHQIRLIHLSTDYVFDGQTQRPYREEDKTNPINVYGKTKWLGEQAVRMFCKEHIILRVSGVFSEFGHNFFKTMLKLGQEKKTLRIVADQFTCPTDANDIASAIYVILKQPQHHGTYHFCSEPVVSWHTFAENIFHTAQHTFPLIVEEITAIDTSEYPTAAQRPHFSALDCEKIKDTFGITSPPLFTSIKQLIARISS